MGDVQRFRTQGGWHIELPVPLSENDQKRVDHDQLTAVDSDGLPIVSEAYATGGVTPAGNPGTQNGTGQAEPVVPEPASEPRVRPPKK
jgi:hypothetical protein